MVVIANLFLFGCAVDPMTKLGLSESEWLGYGSDEQQKLLANYKKIAEKRAGTVRDKKNHDARGFLEIDVLDGKVMMPPFVDWSDYKPVNFTIFRGQCRDIVLQGLIDEKSQTELGVCFYGDTLYLDPSHHDLEKHSGSISIHSSPLWLSGFSYKGISSTGYVRLNNVTIKILQKENAK
ncbi:MAG: putative membrane associated protein [uncultured bacterium]|nr:MAG: putative membrane associated protein [uncultured bacterium]